MTSKKKANPHGHWREAENKARRQFGLSENVADGLCPSTPAGTRGEN